jgi:hypothetical protein
MRVIALLSLLFGFTGLMLLDGQTFTHVVMGLILGVVAFACGFGSARRDQASPTCRWEGFNKRSADYRYANDLVSGFRTDREFALKSQLPEAVRYLAKLQFPEGKPSPFSGSLSNYVETARREAVGKVVAHLRTTAETDLGTNPVAWIEKYGGK